MSGAEALHAQAAVRAAQLLPQCEMNARPLGASAQEVAPARAIMSGVEYAGRLADIGQKVVLARAHHGVSYQRELQNALDMADDLLGRRPAQEVPDV